MKQHLIKRLCLLLFLLTPFASKSQKPSVTLQHLGRWNSELVGKPGSGMNTGELAQSETVAYDSMSKRAFSTNGDDKSFNIVDVSDIINPKTVKKVSISPYSGINCVAVRNGIVAVALEGIGGFYDNGAVVFYDTGGRFINKVVVGVMPDMLTFTPDGKKLLVANEGEIGTDLWIANDPLGSVSIIDMTPGAANITQDNIKAVDFRNYDWTFQTFATTDLDTFTSKWQYDVYPGAYTSGGGFWGITKSPSDGMRMKIRWQRSTGSQAWRDMNFWHFNNTHTAAGGGNFFHHLSFAENIENRPKPATLSFNYYARNFTSADSIGYVVAWDNGTTWNKSKAVWLSAATAWATIEVPVPSGAKWVRLRLLAKTNTATASGGFDNIKIRYCSNKLRQVIPNTSLSQDLEPEYISVDENSKYAYVSIQEASGIGMLDIEKGEWVRIMSMDYQDHSKAGNEIDPSDNNSIVNITTWPLKTHKMPDGIDVVNINGQTFILTANEGDEKLNEDRRMRDNRAFIKNPSALYTLANDNNLLGRLRHDMYTGDYDFDGFYDELFGIGSRSFSIYDTAMNLIYDSGSDLEKITYNYYNDATSNHYLPDAFNSDNEGGPQTSLKNRSDNKGPEPEAIHAHWIGDSLYAFISLERIGGIMVYNITNPYDVRFVTYNNNRDFGADFTDLGPEYMAIIPKSQNNTGMDVIIHAHERSGTLVFWGIKTERPLVSFSRSSYTINENAGDLTLKVKRVGTADSVISVYIQDMEETAKDSVDYDLDENEKIEFLPAGASEKDFKLKILDNNTYDGDRTVTLKLVHAKNAFYDTVITTVKIIDNESKPTIALNKAASYVENAGIIRPSFSKNIRSSKEVTIKVSAVGGSATPGADFQFSTTNIVFPAMDTMSKQLSIQLTDNDIYEKTETIVLEYTIMNGDAIIKTKDTLMIADDETIPSISFEQGDMNVFESAGDVFVPLVISDSSSFNAEVQVAVDGSSTATANDYIITNNKIAYAPFVAGAKELKVQIIDNNIDDNDKTLVLLTNAPGPDNTAGGKKITINIINDDLPSGITGIKGKELLVYPNPAKDVLHIASPKNILKVTLTDIVGRDVTPEMIFLAGNKVRVDVSALEKGIYIMTLNIEGKTFTNKIIIQ